MKRDEGKTTRKLTQGDHSKKQSRKGEDKINYKGENKHDRVFTRTKNEVDKLKMKRRRKINTEG